jgi:hypothetical protein
MWGAGAWNVDVDMLFGRRGGAPTGGRCPQTAV